MAATPMGLLKVFGDHHIAKFNDHFSVLILFSLPTTFNHSFLETLLDFQISSTPAVLPDFPAATSQSLLLASHYGLNS